MVQIKEGILRPGEEEVQHLQNTGCVRYHQTRSSEERTYLQENRPRCVGQVA